MPRRRYYHSRYTQPAPAPLHSSMYYLLYGAAIGLGIMAALIGVLVIFNS